jgi:hypothetical protein
MCGITLYAPFGLEISPEKVHLLRADDLFRRLLSVWATGETQDFLYYNDSRINDLF